MPTYVYRREDGTTFEIEQRITEPALKTCPTTDQPVTRLISPGAGLVFKGSGFYLTDYARNGQQKDKKLSGKTKPIEKTAQPGNQKDAASSEKSGSEKSTSGSGSSESNNDT